MHLYLIAGLDETILYGDDGFGPIKQASFTTLAEAKKFFPNVTDVRFGF
jgi:hypothetical protein